MNPPAPRRTPSWRRLDLGDQLLPESPRWAPQTRTLGWVDIVAGTLAEATYCPRTRTWSSPRVRHLGGMPTSAEPVPDQPRAWDVVRDGRLHRLPASQDTLTDPGRLIVEDFPAIRTNDTTRDPAGRLLAGLFTEDRTSPAGGVVSLQPPHGPLHHPVTGVVTANGIGLSGDGETLYLIDTARGHLLAFPYDTATGRAGAGTVRVQHEGPGKLDGLLVRPDETLLVAVWDEAAVHRYDPSGRLLEIYAAPASRPTALAALSTPAAGVVLTCASTTRGATPAPGSDQERPDGGLYYTEEIR